MAKSSKTSQTITADQWKKLRDSGMSGSDIHGAVANGSLNRNNASTYKPTGSSGGSGGLPQLSAVGSGGSNAPATDSVVNGVANGDWMNPNTSYIKSGAYLDNANISDRGKAQMAADARNGFNFDSVPSNISQYSGVDANSSDNDKLMSYMYNNMRNMSPEQQSETVQGVQDLYTAAGRGDDVFAAYNNAVFGDGTGTNGLAAQEAQRNAAPEQGEYTLSNSAQRAEATTERNQLQTQIDEYKNGELYNQAKRDHPNASEAELAIYVQEAYDDEIKRNPNGDLAKADAKIKELDTNIGNLTSAIDEENRAGEKATNDYRTAYISDNYMRPAMEYAQRDPSLARGVAIQYAIDELGQSREAAIESAPYLLQHMTPELALRLVEHMPTNEQQAQFDSLRNEYARQRQGMSQGGQLRQDIGQNRFDVNRGFSSNPLFNYQPNF